MKSNKKEYFAAYRAANRELIRERQRLWRENNRERCRQYGRNWMKKYRKENRDKVLENRRRWYKANAITERKRSSEWSKRNRDKITARGRAAKKAYFNRVYVRLRQMLSKRIYNAIDRKLWSIKTMELLGCSLKEFMSYLESKFKPGMTWGNYGKHGWHVDHIMPCAAFDLTKPEHRRRCFHFSNLQPLFARENLSKGAKLTTNQFNLL